MTKEFSLNNGTCWIALSYAIEESKAQGIEYGTQAYYDFIATRKYEIWQELENKTYKFNAYNTTL
jgi:hypothetical protein